MHFSIATQQTSPRSNDGRNMPSEHCPECEPDAPCKGKHVYVLALPDHVGSQLVRPLGKGLLYVGTTGKSVPQRIEDNWKKNSDGSWKHNTAHSKMIRRAEDEARLAPEFYREFNPVENQPDAELGLALLLLGSGYHVRCDALKRYRRRLRTARKR